MKGIILAGGSGTRLRPMTSVVSKQLLPIYDKPMIYYPISTLMLGGIRDIAIITTPEEKSRYQELLQHFSQLGVTLTFIVQEQPDGLAHALILAADFIAGEGCVLILGDNVFFGHDLSSLLKEAIKSNVGATIFGYRVSDPCRYGVVEFDEENKVIDLVEKPDKPVSSYAVTGLYIYDSKAVSYACSLTPSSRGELEITDLNKLYLNHNALKLVIMGRGFSWLDTGTPNSLLDAGKFVQTIEARQGLKVACPEEIAWRNGWVSTADVERIASQFTGDYRDYLRTITNENTF